MTIGHAITGLSSGNLLIALALTMVTCIVFGTVSVTMVAYGLTAIIIAPALVSMGLSLLQAHFFVLFFAVLSAVTPPIAMNALGASSIAGSNYFKTSVTSWSICISAYVIPYLIVWNPTLLLQPPDLLSGILTMLAVILGLLAVNIVVTGYYMSPLNALQRVLFGLCAIGLWGYGFTLNYTFLIAGLLLLVVLSVWQKTGSKRSKLILETTSSDKEGGGQF